MAEHQQTQRHPTNNIKNQLLDNGPSASQVLSVATLLPIGGILLALSGMTLTGTLIGLAVATPLFVICSPVLVPAAIVIGLAVTGFLASGAFGLTGLTSLSWIFDYVRGERGSVPEQMEHLKRRMEGLGGRAGRAAE